MDIGNDKEQILSILKEKYQKEGFKVGDGLKYGVDFLLYTDNVNKVHSKYAILLNREFTFHQLIPIQRVCQNVKKILILVDYIDGEIYQSEISRKKFIDFNEN